MLLLVLIVAVSASAIPLAEYKAHIHQAFTEISSATVEERSESAQQHTEILTRALNNARQLVPTDETVEWEGGHVRVNNSWLEEELRSFHQLSPNDPRGSMILAHIIERLGALEDRLTELDPRNNTTVTSTSKAQEKARLEATLRREEFQDKPPQKNIFQRMWERFKEWLNSLFPRSNGLAPGQMSWAAFIAMIFIFTLAAGVLAYAISKLVPYLQRRMTRLNLERPEARIVLGEHLAPDQTASTLLAEAEALARKGELRAAIRLAYIALLCELGDRKVLVLAQHKTNHDYLRAVREKRKRPLLDEMQKLTNSFENHWYGFQQTTADDWTTFRSGFEKVMNYEF
jgi:inhibitor of KinA sporulation pathway (predicted exonuclease)